MRGIKESMSTFSYFVETYRGPKLAIFAFGGGLSLARLATVHEGSNLLGSFVCPNTQEDCLRVLRAWGTGFQTFEQSPVSPGAAQELFVAMETMFPDYKVVAITASGTSSVWEKEQNVAYIVCRNSCDVVETWKLNIPTATEDEHLCMTPDEFILARSQEDEGVGNTALALVNNIPRILNNLKCDATLTLCEPGPI